MKTCGWFILGVLLFTIFAWLFITYINYQCWKQDEIDKLKKKANENNEPYTDKQLEDEVVPNRRLIIRFAVLICFGLWIAGGIVTHVWSAHFFNVPTKEDSPEALFGDSFGAVNALISAAAFACMVVSLIMQRSELKLQRKELEAQRLEFKQQNHTLAFQRFENTFFNMMELQQQIVNDLSFDNKEVDSTAVKKISGRELFRFSFSPDFGNASPKLLWQSHAK